MEPGPSDPALETPLLQKLQGWGVVLVAFFVVWLPYNWLIEPSTNLEQEEALRTQAIERGRRSVELFSEENQLGVGCVRCHGPELRGSVIPAGTGWAYPPDLTTICGGPSTGHPLIKSVTDIQTTIEQGRGNDAVVEHPVPGRARRPADQRHRELPGAHELGERPVRGQHLHQPRRGQGGQLAVGLAGGDERRHGVDGRDRIHRRDGGDRLMLAQEVHTCLGFHIECGTLFKGAGVTIMAFILFVGSVYLMLSLVFGKWMGYLVLAVCFSGWLIIQSSLWYFGFWAQGPGTPTNQGPRGQEPSWVVLEAGLTATDARFATFEEYPDDGWEAPNAGQLASVQSVSSAATSFLAAQANEELGLDPLGTDAITGTQFTIDSVKFATAEDDKTSLAGGAGALLRRRAAHDAGAVPRLRKRPALLADVHGGVAPVVRDPSAAARPRREEAQGVPDRRERARVVRPRIVESETRR